MARNWLYAHTMNFYDEMSLNRNQLSFPAGICGGQVRCNSLAAPAGRFSIIQSSCSQNHMTSHSLMHDV